MPHASDYCYEIRASSWVTVQDKVTYATSLEDAQAISDRWHVPGWSVAIFNYPGRGIVEYRPHVRP